MCSMIYVLWVLLSIVFMTISQVSAETAAQCEYNIYEKCLVAKTQFTDEELNTIHKYLIKRYTIDADLKPVRAPCSKLVVRRDFKCLTEDERMAFINAFRELYLDGSIYRHTDIHSRYWPAYHKFAEFNPGHGVFLHGIDKLLDRKHPGMISPYWLAVTPFADPRKDMIWRYVGTAGDHSNGYVVTDGPLYKDLDPIIPITRQWLKNNTWICPWDSPELQSSALQKSVGFLTYSLQFVGYHFLVHLAIGNYYGTMSVSTAPQDVMFALYHFGLSLLNLKFYLRDNKFLTPLTYDNFDYLDQETGLVRGADIRHDVVTYYRNVTVLESFQIGFGDYCVIPDRLAVAILDIENNITRPVPKAITRLPKQIQLKYFPKFYHGTYTPFDHVFDDVGDCNTECKKMPKFCGYFDDENGIRQFRRYHYDEDYNIELFIKLIHNYFKLQLKDFNSSGYCSPYVT